MKYDCGGEKLSNAGKRYRPWPDDSVAETETGLATA